MEISRKQVERPAPGSFRFEKDVSRIVEYDRSCARDRRERSGLWIAGIEIPRLHYADTLRHWRWRLGLPSGRSESGFL